MSRFTEADRLLRLIVRERVQCERCGEPGSEVAHIVPRRFHAVRCDELNVWFLCNGPGSNGCHELVDSHEVHLIELVHKTIGWGAYERLRTRSLSGLPDRPAAFWKSETARLRQICADRGIPHKRSA